MKTYCCWRCKQWKPREAFGTRSDNGKRIFSCIECLRDYGKEYYAKAKERKKAKAREYYEANKDRRKAYLATRKDKDRVWNREYKLQTKYGLSAVAVDCIITEGQRSCCPICDRYIPVADTKRWHVDHCHTTGKIRGIICTNCNTMLGQAQDNPETLRRAAAYLEGNQNDREDDLCETKTVHMVMVEDKELSHLSPTLFRDRRREAGEGGRE